MSETISGLSQHNPTENSTALQLTAKETGWDEGNKNRNFFI